MSTSTSIVDSKFLVKELAASMHMHGRMFSCSRGVDFRLLLRHTSVPVVKLLEEFIGVQDFRGSIEVKPNKRINTRELFRILINIAASHVAHSFRYFAKQLEKLRNDLDEMKRIQPEQFVKLEEAAQILQLIIKIDNDYTWKHRSGGWSGLVNPGHKNVVCRFGKSICHRVPQFAESLGLDERTLTVWVVEAS